MEPHYSQSSRENATPSSGTSPLAYYYEVIPPGDGQNLNLSYNCVARSLLTVAPRIKQLSRNERFGTVKIHHLNPPSWALLSSRKQPGTGNCGQMVQKFPGIPEKARKRNTSEGITFFPKTFHRNEPFHLNSPRNYRVFRTNGKRSGSSPEPPPF